MKYFTYGLFFVLFAFGANAASTGRLAVNTNRVISAPRYTASVKQIGSSVKSGSQGEVITPVSETVEEVPVKEEDVISQEPEIDMREAERNACISNNIGIGNTFVWASRYSNTSNYATMVEDTIHPENNVCFVKVELDSSNDSRIQVYDIEPQYFMWNENITCGSWVDKKEMEKRILEARKGERIGGIVASTVGGLGLGVGAMELFGNKLIGGKVEGQKSASLSKQELYKSQLLALKSKNSVLFDEYVENLKLLSDACDNNLWHSDNCSLYKELYREVK